MLHSHHRALEPDAGGLVRLIELGIARPRGNDGFLILRTGKHCGHQAAHQQSRDGGIAVREVELIIGAKDRIIGQCHPGEPNSPGAGRRVRRTGVHPHVVAEAYPGEERQALRQQARRLQEKVLIAHVLQRLGLLGG